MAKVSFSKLKCKVNEEVKIVPFSAENIEVRQYLPIQEKLALMERVVELAHDADFNYSNPVKTDVFKHIEILQAYTNIVFTEKQKEDIPKLYDLILSSGLLKTVLEAIPEEELGSIECGIWRSIDAIYQYQYSVLGIINNIKNNYDNLNLDVEALNEKIADPETLAFVKGILDNLR